ncbi:MAG TPA: M23 family metallopeptidase [Nocardioidaceae bacterium]|nr:M23 family metallopeptidase [Nocardioidaceae bacterium]
MSSHRRASLAAAAATAVLLTLTGPIAASAPIATGASGADTDLAVWPLTPRPAVVAGFDPPAQDWNAGHRGVDLRGAPGQTVRAARSGRISYAGLLAGRGVVVVSHGDTRTTYQPVASSVNVGDRVIAGQAIGALTTFGSHCWPLTCLHWGFLRGETYLNPLTLVGAAPVRLLPLYAPLPPVPLAPAGSAPVDEPATSGVPISVPWSRQARPTGFGVPTSGATYLRPEGVLVGMPDAGGLW